jgi:hypothetical protein
MGRLKGRAAVIALLVAAWSPVARSQSQPGGTDAELPPPPVPSEPVRDPEGARVRVEPVAPPPPIPPQRAYRIRVLAEAGLLDPLANIGSFGDRATRFDFIRDGGQDNVYFYSRWSAELSLRERHTIVFLYQPLQIESTFVPDREIRERGAVLAPGQPARVTFGFPFYRVSYLYDVLPSPRSELAFGFTAQLRNANYTFESLDGTQLGSVRSVGFVPAIKVRGRHTWESGFFAGFEIDGIYAPIQYFNGSDNETTGAILDASLRAGVRASSRVETFLNVRYLGGGATREGAGDDSSKNWLHFLFLGLGASLELTPPR